MLSSALYQLLNFTTFCGHALQSSLVYKPRALLQGCWNGSFGCSLIQVPSLGSRNACHSYLQPVENRSKGSSFWQSLISNTKSNEKTFLWEMHSLSDSFLASLIFHATLVFTIILVQAHNQFWESLLNPYQLKVEAIVIETIWEWKGFGQV